MIAISTTDRSTFTGWLRSLISNVFGTSEPERLPQIEALSRPVVIEPAACEPKILPKPVSRNVLTRADLADLTGEAFGLRVKLTRTKQGRSAQQIADAMRREVSWVHAVESGKWRPQPKTVGRFAEALGVSPQYLAGLTAKRER